MSFIKHLLQLAFALLLALALLTGGITVNAAETVSDDSAQTTAPDITTETGVESGTDIAEAGTESKPETAFETESETAIQAVTDTATAESGSTGIIAYLGQLVKDMAKILSKYWYRFLVTGVTSTLLLALVTVVGGTIIGSLLAMGRMSKIAPLRWLIVAFVEVIRGTPSLLQLYVGYLLGPQLFPALKTMQPTHSAFICVAVALILNSAAYVSEIIRSGINAVDKGQTEAARSLGLSGGITMIHVVLPQAIKNILPALGNEFITVIKETSLASTFFAGELMTQYKEFVGWNHNAFPTLMLVGVIYFILNFVLSKIIGLFERRMKHERA